jgi:hypothetical protein
MFRVGLTSVHCLMTKAVRAFRELHQAVVLDEAGLKLIPAGD